MGWSCPRGPSGRVSPEHSVCALPADPEPASPAEPGAQRQTEAGPEPLSPRSPLLPQGKPTAPLRRVLNFHGTYCPND